MQAKVLIINGPNLNTLGTREPDIYGHSTLAEIESHMQANLSEGQIEAEFYQSNHEGELIDKLQSTGPECDLVIINAGALTHYGIAPVSYTLVLGRPVIEVHMTNIYSREPFRRKSLLSPLAVGGIFGFGPLSYYLAARAAIDYLGRKKAR